MGNAAKRAQRQSECASSSSSSGLVSSSGPVSSSGLVSSPMAATVTVSSVGIGRAVVGKTVELGGSVVRGALGGASDVVSGVGSLAGGVMGGVGGLAGGVVGGVGSLAGQWVGGLAGVRRGWRPGSFGREAPVALDGSAAEAHSEDADAAQQGRGGTPPSPGPGAAPAARTAAVDPADPHSGGGDRGSQAPAAVPGDADGTAHECVGGARAARLDGAKAPRGDGGSAREADAAGRSHPHGRRRHGKESSAAVSPACAWLTSRDTAAQRARELEAEEATLWVRGTHPTSLPPSLAHPCHPSHPTFSYAWLGKGSWVSV